MEESDDQMLGGDEEGDMLLGGGHTARDEDDFFLQGNPLNFLNIYYKPEIHKRYASGPRLGDRLAGLRTQVEEVSRMTMTKKFPVICVILSNPLQGDWGHEGQHWFCS